MYSVHVNNDFARRVLQLWILRKDHRGRDVMLPISWKRDPNPGEAIPPTLELDPEELLELLAPLAQSAWDAGWRPKGFKHEDVTAQTKHLEDMRAIAFSALALDRPA